MIVNILKKIKEEMYLLALFTLVLILYYPTIFFNLNDYYLGQSGDGMKNYYTFLYHLKYGEGFTWFTGMNYPYGEHLVYGDVQASLLIIVKWLSVFFPSIKNWGVFILNGSMFFSLWITPLLIYKIVKHWGVGSVFAGIAAIFIALMNPQIVRMGGHYALSYSCFIPLIWWLYIKHSECKKNKWIVFLSCSMFFFALLHLYYLLIGGAFLALLIFFDFLFDKNRKVIQSAVAFFAVVILPFALTLCYTKLTDTVTDRPDSPFGFLYYRSWIEGILLNFDWSIIKWINKNCFEVRYITMEGVAYVGFPMAVLAIYLLITGGYKLFNRSVKFQFFIKEEGLKKAFFASMLLLLFSFGVPFIWGLSGLVDYLGMIKQFRSIGRFAWVFYYVFTVISVVYFYDLFLKWRQTRKTWLTLWGVTVLMVYAVEAHQKHAFKNGQYQNATEQNLWVAETSKIEEITKKYEYVLPMPFFHIGSEHINKTNTDIENAFMHFSLASGMNTPAVMLSRTSFSQTMNNLQLVYSLHSEPEWLKEQKSPILLMFLRKVDLNKKEQNLFDLSETVYSGQLFVLKEISLEKYKVRAERYNEVFQSKVMAIGNTVGGVNNENSISLFNDKVKLGGGNHFAEVWVKVEREHLEKECRIIVELKNENGEVLLWDEHTFLSEFNQIEKEWVKSRLPLYLNGNQTVNVNVYLKLGEGILDVDFKEFKIVSE